MKHTGQTWNSLAKAAQNENVIQIKPFFPFIVCELSGKFHQNPFMNFPVMPLTAPSNLPITAGLLWWRENGKRFKVMAASWRLSLHYIDVMMRAIASQITGVSMVFPTVRLDQRKQQSSAPLALVRGIHRSPVDSPQKKPVTWRMFPFDDVIMILLSSKSSISGKAALRTAWGCTSMCVVKVVLRVVTLIMPMQRFCNFCEFVSYLGFTAFHHVHTGLILGLRPANKRRRYFVTTSLIGWAQA